MSISSVYHQLGMAKQDRFGSRRETIRFIGLLVGSSAQPPAAGQLSIRRFTGLCFSRELHRNSGGAGESPGWADDLARPDGQG
jgi:hypothetical protein